MPSSCVFGACVCVCVCVTHVQVGVERFHAPEALFRPSLLDHEKPGIAQMVFDTINVSSAYDVIHTQTHTHTHTHTGIAQMVFDTINVSVAMHAHTHTHAHTHAPGRWSQIKRRYAQRAGYTQICLHTHTHTHTRALAHNTHEHMTRLC